MTRNFPYAYRNLQGSLKEINEHLERCGLSTLEKPSTTITLKTPEQMSRYIQTLQDNIQQLDSTALPRLEKSLTIQLCEIFVDDASTFVKDLQHEIDIHSPGLVSYLIGE